MDNMGTKAQPFGSMELASLRQALIGNVFLRGENGFADEIAGYNLAGPVNPDIVVAAVNEDDVVAAVNFASTIGLPVYAQATGHGNYAPIEDGLLIQTSRLNQVTVDPKEGSARLGAGVQWGRVYKAAAPHGLAPITGSSPTVGAVGLILGGGIGPLSRTYGFASDYAREFRVVLEDSTVVVADKENEPDLFWALRGGKGGLGIVTEVTIGLVEQATIYGGGLFFSADDATSVFHAWLDWTETVPDSVTSSVALVRYPPLASLPAELQGKTALHLRFAYTGTEDSDDAARRISGEALAKPLREIANPILDTLDLMSAEQTGTIHADPPDPMPVWEQGALLDKISHEFIDVLFQHVGPDLDVPLSAIEVRHLGGALRCAQGGAVGGRAADYTLVLIGKPEASLFHKDLPELGSAVKNAVERWYCDESNYNFSGHPKTAEEFAQNWPPSIFDRLSTIRNRYDPARRFPIGSHTARASSTV